jgi:hypothetical protein
MYVPAFEFELSVASGTIPSDLIIALTAEYGTTVVSAADIDASAMEGCQWQPLGDVEPTSSIRCVWGDAGGGVFWASAEGFQPVYVAMSADGDGCHPVTEHATAVLEPL